MIGDGTRSSTLAQFFFFPQEYLEEHWILSQVAKIEISILQREKNEEFSTLCTF